MAGSWLTSSDDRARENPVCVGETRTLLTAHKPGSQAQLAVYCVPAPAPPLTLRHAEEQLLDHLGLSPTWA